MQKQKQISTLVGIIIVVAVAIVLFGGVFAYQYYTTKSEVQNLKSETNSNVQSETAGWKTYKNDKYGVEIKYPSAWELSEETVSYSNIKLATLKGVEGTIQLDYGQGVVATCKENIEKIQVGNEQFDGCHFVNSGSPEYWYMHKNLDNFDFRIYAVAKDPSLSNRDIILNILSTFKFTK